MKKKVKHRPARRRMTAKAPNVFEQLGFESAEAAALERKSALYSKVVTMARERGLPQRKLAALLGISQPMPSGQDKRTSGATP
jgi:predicted XRE-type DNA-binding protein